MKKIFLGILIGLGLIATTAYAGTVFNSNQVGSSPSNGKVLQTNGTTSTWVATSTLGISGGSGTPSSPVNSLQFNNAGSFGGSANLLFNGTNRIDFNGTLTATSTLITNATTTNFAVTSNKISLNGLRYTVPGALPSSTSTLSTDSAGRLSWNLDQVWTGTGTKTAEQCGMVGDGVTDDGPALQTCLNGLPVGGTIVFGSKTYQLNTLPILIATSTVNLIGSSDYATIFNTTDTTHDVFQLTGTAESCAAGSLLWNKLSNFKITRTSDASAGFGINVSGGCWIYITDIQSYNSIRGFSFKGAAQTQVYRTQASWNSSGGARYGYYIDNSTGGNVSSYFDRVVTNCSSLTSGDIGFYVSAPMDLYVTTLETNHCNIGYDQTGQAQDVHLIHHVHDGCLTCMHIDNSVGLSQQGPGTTISDAYMGASGSNSIGLDLSAAGNVTVTGGTQIFAPATNGIAIKAINSSRLNVSGSIINSSNGAGFDFATTTYSSFTNNTFYANSADPTGTGIKLKGGSTNNTLSGNKFGGYYTTAINISAGANSNIVWPNDCDLTHGTNCILDSGTSNMTATPQPLLVSGTNIKTINGNSLLGSGDLIISGGGGAGGGWSTSTVPGIYNSFGVVVGINSSTPIANLVIQGSGASSTIPILVVASSSGSSYLTVNQAGLVTIPNLTTTNATTTGQMGWGIVNYLPPPTQGASSTVLTTNGAGQLSWGTAGGGGTPCTTTNFSLQYDSGGSFACAAKFLTNSTVIGWNATSSTIDFNIQGTAGTNDILNVASSSGNSILKVSALSRVGINSSTPQSTLTVVGNSGQTYPLLTVASSSNASLFTVSINNLITDVLDVNTSTPVTSQAILFVQGSSGGTANIFSAASSSGTSVMKIDSNGHVHYGGPTPSVSSCGTNPSVTGNDTIGDILTGSASPVACTLTFANAYTNVVCVLTDDLQTSEPAVTATSTTAIIMTFSAALSSHHVYYNCADKQ